MADLWVDANVLLRLLTGEPPDLAQRSLRLAERAERGEVTLRISSIVVAEIVWVFYRCFSRRNCSARRWIGCIFRSRF